MLISCRFSIVGLHLLLLTHMAHSFVLLTANVEDVKRIARKFVSDSLAEKIADFIARATETMTHNTKNSEENDNNADPTQLELNPQESSQVSAENRMYNGKEPKSKEEIGEGKVKEKVPRKTSVERNRHGLEDSETTLKPKKQPKPLHGRSRYIIQTENKALAPEKAISKTRSEEYNYNNMKESIQLLEDRLRKLSTPEAEIKAKKQKKKKIKGRAYKLLSGFTSDENDAARSIPNSKGIREDDRFFNIRAMGEKKLSSVPKEEAATRIEKHAIENEEPTENAATNFDQYGIKDETNTEMVSTNEPSQLTVKDEFDQEENKIIEKIVTVTEKVVRSGRSYGVGTDDKRANWWEKELPAHTREVNSQGKSWF